MDPDRVGTQWLEVCSRCSNWFPIYMDPDRVGTAHNMIASTSQSSFQFIWIPTESGL